jgi:putative FmdB family regulatory protein
MPIYEYFCSQCNKVHEVLQRISEEPLRQCPVCGSETIQKMVSRAAFQLKGSGWYVTDFKDKKTGKQESQPEADKSGHKTAAPASESSSPANDAPKTQSTPPDTANG